MQTIANTLAVTLLLLTVQAASLTAAEPFVPLPVPSLTPSLPFFPSPPLVVPVPVIPIAPAVPVSR